MLHRGVLTSISAVDRFPDVSEPGMDVSPYGVNLMAGSIREWTCSRWLVQSERHTVFEELRSLAPRLVVKGASFLESHEYSRAAARGWALGTIGHHDVGFRLVKRVE